MVADQLVGESIRLSSSAVATSQEGRRTLRSGRAGQHRRWGPGDGNIRIKRHSPGAKGAGSCCHGDGIKANRKEERPGTPICVAKRHANVVGARHAIIARDRRKAASQSGSIVSPEKKHQGDFTPSRMPPSISFRWIAHCSGDSAVWRGAHHQVVAGQGMALWYCRICFGASHT